MKRFMNSNEVAQILGVNVSTIKRWTDAGKLPCIQTAGGHRKFLIKHINAFLKEQGTEHHVNPVMPFSQSNFRRIALLAQRGQFKELVPMIYSAAKDGRTKLIETCLQNLYLAGQPIHVTGDKLLFPVLNTIGMDWENDNLSILGEHIASQAIRDAVMGFNSFIEQNNSKRDRILLACFQDDLHDIALRIIKVIIEAEGLTTVFTGQVTPASEIISIVGSEEISAIYLSSTWIENLSEAKSEFDTLWKSCRNQNVPLFYGGQGFDSIEVPPEGKSNRLQSFKDVYQSLTERN